MAQWLRIRLPIQGRCVRALVWEDPTCCGATKPMCHNYWACAPEPASHNYWSPCATTTEAHVPRARGPQQEKPPQWEGHTPQWRVALLAATRESPCTAMKMQCSQKKKKTPQIPHTETWRLGNLRDQVPWRPQVGGGLKKGLFGSWALVFNLSIQSIHTHLPSERLDLWNPETIT